MIVNDEAIAQIKMGLEEGSFPIFTKVPKGTLVIVTDPSGNKLLDYTTLVDIPRGSKISVG